MDVLYSVLSWGSPVGISLFFLFSGIGAGIFFWGISQLSRSVRRIKKKSLATFSIVMVDDSAQE